MENEQPDTLNMLLEQTGARENLIRPDQHERVPLHYAAIEEKPEVCFTDCFESKICAIGLFIINDMMSNFSITCLITIVAPNIISH